MFIAKISKKGQVTVPATIRKHLKLGPGGRIAFTIESDGVRLLSAEKGIEGLRGALRVTESQDFKAVRQEVMEEVARDRASKNSGH